MANLPVLDYTNEVQSQKIHGNNSNSCSNSNHKSNVTVHSRYPIPLSHSLNRHYCVYFSTFPRVGTSFHPAVLDLKPSSNLLTLFSTHEEAEVHYLIARPYDRLAAASLSKSSSSSSRGAPASTPQDVAGKQIDDDADEDDDAAESTALTTNKAALSSPKNGQSGNSEHLYYFPAYDVHERLVSDVLSVNISSFVMLCCSVSSMIRSIGWFVYGNKRCSQCDSHQVLPNSSFVFFLFVSREKSAS